jgi:hypothetical protein
LLGHRRYPEKPCQSVCERRHAAEGVAPSTVRESKLDCADRNLPGKFHFAAL